MSFTVQLSASVGRVLSPHQVVARAVDLIVSHEPLRHSPSLMCHPLHVTRLQKGVPGLYLITMQFLSRELSAFAMEPRALLEMKVIQGGKF
jgi:hypothetical protein